MEKIIKELKNIMIEAALRDKNCELVERMLASGKKSEESIRGEFE